MRFDRVRLENFKCYADADLRLDAGVTVIHGLNGSGKSSLLEACFFALYGARALDRTLDEVVTIGEDETVVELWFTHGGGSYHLRRRIRATTDQPQTAECVLETPDGSIDGATDVEAHVRDLLRMDAEAFVNCAYVRQGEVNKLINATPGDRQDMIDDLLQLGKLEAYRGRASDARLAVREVLGNKQELLRDKEKQIANREDRDLHATLNELETERKELSADIERFEENRETAQESLSDAEDVLAEYEEKREELEAERETVEELREKIAETERERDRLKDALAERREEVDALDARIEDLLDATDLDAADADDIAARRDELDAEREAVIDDRDDVISELKELKGAATKHAERADDLESRAEAKREEADDLEAAADAAAEKVTAGEERVADIADTIDEKTAAFDDAPVDVDGADAHLRSVREEFEALRERETELEAELATARSRVEEGEALLSEGKCPECGQPVDDSPHVDALSDHREAVERLTGDLSELEAEKEALGERVVRAEELRSLASEVRELQSDRNGKEELLAELRSNAAEKREQADALREEAERLEAEAESARDAATTKRDVATEKQAELGSLNAKKERLRADVERLDALADAVDEREDREADVERLREKRADLADRNDERREHLSAARERASALAEEYDEGSLEEAAAEKERAESYLANVEEELADLRERRDAVGKRIGAVEKDIEQLETLREEREAAAERVESLRSLYGEAETLESMYGDLRAELRQRNVDVLERMLNETFDLVYQNDSYARIELSGEYELTVYQKDGEPLDPEQLSGGERALFNLSLRCAIYQLLAEGIEGAAPMPPLILDEPTVFLDSGHVTRLVELVDSMQELGVEQIVVVSHDDELVSAAEDLVRVEKDATTNRSHVERVATATL